VLLVGHLDAVKLSTFLGEFFHPDRRTDGSSAAFYHVGSGSDWVAGTMVSLRGVVYRPSTPFSCRVPPNTTRWSSFPTSSPTTRYDNHIKTHLSLPFIHLRRHALICHASAPFLIVQLIEVMESPLIESRVTFIKGTIMNEDDLVRAGANTAVACFVFNDGLAADPEAADAITVLRVLVLKIFRPVLPCYVQLHQSQNRTQLHMLKKQRLVCIEDLKMSIMGLSALYPGFTTLLTNLLKSSVDHVADPGVRDRAVGEREGG